MQKLGNGIVEKMIAAKLTSKEIDFMLYISRFQDDNGHVSGVHYKEVCENAEMSYQGFYDVKQSLIDKNFIASDKSNRIDHDITILNNSFKGDEDYNAGYINTNHHIFYTKEFRYLKAGAKLLAMWIMKATRSGGGEWKIGTVKFYDKYTKMFGVTKRVMRTYLMQLKEFFSIGIKEGIYYMRPKNVIYRKPNQKTENENYTEHEVEVTCRRNRIKILSQKDKKDVYELATRQYKKKAEVYNLDIIDLLRKAIEISIERLNENNPKCSVRVLKPNLVHKILRKELLPV